jgi:AP2 domain.
MPVRHLPSATYLRESFTYNRRTGVLRWKRRRREFFKTDRDWKAWNTLYFGQIAGVLLSRGYCGVRLFGVRYQSHRVIWKLVTGKEPAETIDHIDGNPSNNRWNNLRAATFTEQQYNSPVQKNNRSGHRGVNRVHGKWRAEIWINGKSFHLGLFDTIDAAVSVRENAARKLHGKFYRRPM